jgi:hypothetical protein
LPSSQEWEGLQAEEIAQMKGRIEGPGVLGEGFTCTLPSPLPQDKVWGRQRLVPGSLTLSPQPTAPHQGHFFKRTFQGGVRWDLSKEPGHTGSEAAPDRLPGKMLPGLSSLRSHSGDV